MSMADDDRKNTKDSWLNKMPSEVKAEAHKQTWRFTKAELEILAEAMALYNEDHPWAKNIDLANRIAAGIENC